MAGDPARLLATVAQAREAGWGVALDDVGATPASLAVLPFVRPDLIKLDMRLLRGRTTAEAAHIVNSVRAHAERTDAVVLAEGIETNKHAREAVAAGATLGQGFLFGHPGAAPGHQGPAGRDGHAAGAAGPGRVRAQRAAGLLPVGRPVHRAARSRYEFLAIRAAFPGALGHGMPVAPVAGVRGADLAADDPLRQEWDLVVIGLRLAAALAARDRGDGGPDDQRRFDVVVTHDRDLVIRAAEPLLRRLVPER